MNRKPKPPALPDIADPDSPDAQADDFDDAALQIESETGVDLSQASDLDADHVVADEESTRWKQAPD